MRFDIKGFSERLKVLVQDAGSMRKLAEKSGVSNGTIGNYVNGTIKSRPSVVNIRSIAAVMCVSTEWLETGEGMKADILANTAPAADINLQNMRWAIIALEMLERKRNIRAKSPDSKADAVMMVYEFIQGMGKTIENESQVAEIIPFAERALKMAA